MKKRIILYSPQFPPLDWSGRNSIAYSVAKYLSKQPQYDFRILSTRMDNYEEEIKELFPNLTRILIKEEHRIDSPFYNLFSTEVENLLLEEILRITPDIVIFQDLINIPARIISLLKEKQIKVIIHVHNYYPFCLQYHLFKYPPCRPGLCNGLENPEECVSCYVDNFFKGFEFKERHQKAMKRFVQLRREYMMEIYRSADQLIIPSEFVKKCYEEKLQRKCRLIRHGIELTGNVLKKNKNKKTVFSYLGAIDFNKGILVALKAFSQIKKSDFEFRIYGTGGDAFLMKKLKMRDKRIVYKGKFSKSDLPDIFSQTDMTVIPSYSENYPNTIMESLAYQTPVLASDAGGIPELIQNGINGVLFEKGNALDLKRKIEGIVKNKKLISIYRKNIRPVRNIEDMGKDYSDILSEPSQALEKYEINEMEKQIRKMNFVFTESYDSYLELKKTNEKLFLKKIKAAKVLRNSPAERLKVNALKKEVKIKEIVEIFNQYREADDINDVLYWAGIFFELNACKECERCIKAYFKKLVINQYDAMIGLLWVAILRKRQNKSSGLYWEKIKRIPVELSRDKLVKFYQIASLIKIYGKFDYAERIFNDILSVSKNDKIISGANFHIGEMLFDQGRYADSEKYFINTLKVVPKHLKVQNYLRSLPCRK